MASSLGEAIIDIKINVNFNNSHQKLVKFFDDLATKAGDVSKAVGTASTSINTLTTGVTAAATSTKALATNLAASVTSVNSLNTGLKTLNTSLAGTATAAGAANQGLQSYSSGVSKGIALAQAGAKANAKYQASLRALKDAASMPGTPVTAGQVRVAKTNIKRERDQETFSEALRRSKLSADPAKDYFQKQADALSKKVVSGAMSATAAIKQYNNEVAKVGTQGGFKSQIHQTQMLKVMTQALGKAYKEAQKKAEEAAKAMSLKEQKAAAAADFRKQQSAAKAQAMSVGRGLNLAAPQIAAQQQVKKDIQDVNNALAAGVISKKQATAAIKALNREYAASHSRLGRFNQSLQAMGQKMHTVSMRLRDAGRQLMMFGGAAIGAITPVIIANAKFEQSVKDVSAVLGSVGKNAIELKQLAEQFLYLGERSEFTASQIAEGAKTLARAGFTAREVQAAMSGVVSLASSAGITLDESARVAANITRAFQLSADSFGFVADRITAIAVNSNAAVQDIAESFKYVSPIAASFGQSIESIGAAIGVLANAGTRGSRAGTGLSRFFSELIEPRKIAKIQDLLASVGESVDSLVPDQVDLRDMIALLDRLMKARKISAGDISKIFDQRSTRAVLSLLNQGIDEFDNMYDKIANASGLADEIRAERLDTLMGDWLKFTSALNTSMITLGGSVNSQLREVLQYAVFLVRELTESFKESDGQLVKTVAIFGGVASAIGIVATVAGSLMGIFAALAILGGPLTVLIGVVATLGGLLAAGYMESQLLTAKSMASALRDLKDSFAGVNKNLIEATNRLNSMREAVDKLRRIATLTPVDLSNLVREGKDPFDTSKLKESRKALKADSIAIGGQIQNIIDKINRLDKSRSRWDFAKNVKIDEEIKVLFAVLDELQNKRKSIRETIENIGNITDDVTESARLMALGYADSRSELEKINKLIDSQKERIDIFKMSSTGTPDEQESLSRMERELSSLEASKAQLAEQVGADPRLLEMINKIGVAVAEVRQLEIDGAPEQAIASKKAELASYWEQHREMVISLNKEKDAIKELEAAEEELEKHRQERQERGMTEVEKKVKDLEEKQLAEATALKTVLTGSEANVSQLIAQLKSAEADLAIAKAKGDAEEIKKAEEALTNLETRIQDAQTKVADLKKAETELPKLQADERQAIIDEDRAKTEKEILDLTRKAALAVAQKNKDLATELKLLREIREEELKREIDDLKAKGADPAALAEFEKNRREVIDADLDEVNKKRTTDYLDEIDKLNLADAKRNNNLAEQIRLTEKLGKAEIARAAAEIADAGIRQQFEDAKNRELQAELDELKKSAVSKSPVSSDIQKIQGRDDDIMKKRVENQDKIRDALASQVKTLYDAQMLNAYLFKLERARANHQNKARISALNQAQKLQKMASKGASEWAMARQFSTAAQSLDMAKRSGVSDAALSPASNVLLSLPANVPGPTQRPMPGGAGTSIVNSNNNTITIEAGGIVISGVEDAEEVEKTVKKVIEDMFKSGPKTKTSRKKK